MNSRHRTGLEPKLEFSQPADFDPSSDDVLAHTYAIYDELRRSGGVNWSDAIHAWVVTSDEYVRAALTDSRLSARHSVQQLGATDHADLGLFGRVPSLATTDPPVHTRLRSLVNAAFTPTSVEQQRPVITALVDELLDKVEAKGTFHVVADLAAPLPAHVIAIMLGLGTDQWKDFKRWSDDLFGAFKGRLATPEEQSAASVGARALEDHLREEIRRAPADGGLLSRIRDAEVGGERLDENEAITICMLLLVGGNETTTGLIVNGFEFISESDELRLRLEANPSESNAAVEEFLRLGGPVQHIARRALEDVQIGDQQIARGDQLLLVTAAANHDETRYACPHAVDLDNSRADHLAFGRGRHFCLGAPLARLEAQIAFQRVFERFSLQPRSSSGEWIGPLIARRIREVTFGVRRKA